MPTSALLIGLALLVPADSPQSAKDDGFQQLFNGRDLTGWYTFLQKHGKDKDPDKVVTVEDGAIHLYKHAPDGAEVVMGYIATDKDHGDYHFKVDYKWGVKKYRPRYELKRDAGLYYHIIVSDAVWPRALQYQVQQTDVGDLLALYGLQLDSWLDPKTKNAEQTVYLPPESGGEPRVLGGKGIGYQRRLIGPFERDGWNTAEIIARGDTVAHILNGTTVNRGVRVRLVDPEKPGESKPITRGRIALEIEAAEIYFRNVRIRPLTSETKPDGGR